MDPDPGPASVSDPDSWAPEPPAPELPLLASAPELAGEPLAPLVLVPPLDCPDAEEAPLPLEPEVPPDAPPDDEPEEDTVVPVEPAHPTRRQPTKHQASGRLMRSPG